ncbi:26S proteasome non-ATPase regulatory subunit 9 [Centruroides vittatus]|uniref:26S proteasome non-ATPase regulatory subunit 9 n=1 Tax=Centruroides vittatus TaxID=120091 RepID=UPI0035100618
MAMEGAKDALMTLMKKKESIEEEINSLFAVLKSQNIGMTDPVVDSEGYPRSDIDVYLVRQTRQRIICLQNDHKEVMKQIEAGLYSLHAEQKESNSNLLQSTQSQDTESLSPFAKVNCVDLNSPADNAGLHIDDTIIQFGSITSKNFVDLSNVANLVQHSVGKPIHVKVIRGTRVFNLSLTPRTWSGKGLLGCNIVPMEKK